MATHKIEANLDVDGEVKGTSLDINGNGDISGTLNVTGAITNAGNTTITLGAPQLILKDSTDDDDHKIVFRNNADADDYLIQTKDFTSAATGDGLFIGSASSDKVALVTNDTTALTIDTSQQSTFTGNLVIPGDIKHSGDTNTYIGFHNADEWRVVTGGTERFEVTNTLSTFAGDVQAAGLYVGSTNTSYDFYNNGTSYLNGATTIDDNTQINGTLTVGVDDTGYDVKFFGATSGRYLLWDESEDSLRFTDNTKIKLGTGNDFQLYHSGSNSFITNLVGDINIINYTDGQDIKFQTDDGSGGVTTYLTIDGGADRTIFSRSSRHSDGVVATFGTSEDLQIYHDGNNSYIDNTTGHLKIRNFADDSDIIFVSDDGAGGTATYFSLDGSIAGGDGTGTLFTIWPDNSRIGLGSNADLRIYHDGTDSKIINLEGDLQISQYVDDKDIIFKCDDGSGGVETYFYLDGSASGGNPVTIFPDSSTLRFGNSGDLQLYHDGSNSYVAQTGTGDLYIRNTTDDKDIIFQSDDGSGGVTEYFRLDGGLGYTVASKHILLNDNVKLRVGSSADLEIYHDATDSLINNNNGHVYFTNYADDKDIYFRSDDGSGGVTTYLSLDGSAGVLRMAKDMYIPEYIYHQGDDNTKFGFSAADTFNLHVGGAEVLRVNGGSTTDEAAVSILCGGGTNAENIALLLKGDTNGEALKLKIQNPNNGGTLTGAGILSYEPDADTFNIGQSTTHANMAISIDNSENVTLAAALTVTGNIQCNGNIAGDDGTAITHISSIGADTYAADADSTTRIQMSASSMDFLVADEDVFDINSTTLNVSGTLVAKKHKLAKTSNTDGNADGDIVYFGGTTSMDTGKIYYFNSSGGWTLADADAESTAKGMLGVALGTASDTNGVLIRGMVTLDTDPGTVGDTLFLSTTAGVATATAPSGSGDIVRVIGYCLDSTNGQIYFNPDGAFVEVA